ncbi:MAG: transposase [Candidatus Saccharimonas sp.]
MPIKNTVKLFEAPAYYHVYNRGAGGRQIFRDDTDREKFLSLLARHIDPDNDEKMIDGRVYEKYELEVVAYCLMGSHFHLLIYQESDTTALTKLMRSVATAYTMYFNRKYKQSGHLFQGVYKASWIDDEAYLLHITRYIHMNPRSYIRYKWSSLPHYLGKETPVWLFPERVNEMNPLQYRDFLRSYEGKRAELELLKQQLAG